jgi:hypothetical protein
MYVESNGYPSSESVFSHDDQLVQQVVGRLRSRLGSPVRNFQMAAREDGLILRGQVRTHYGKQIAQEVVMKLSGLSILSNDIEVQCVSTL